MPRSPYPVRTYAAYPVMPSFQPFLSQAVRRLPVGFLVSAAVGLGVLSAPPVGAADAGVTFSSREVLTSMRRVANWQLGTRIQGSKPTDWQMGALYAGLMALSGISDDDRYEAWLLDVFNNATQWRLGKIRYYADHQCVGQAYLELYLKHRRPEMLAEVRAEFDQILARPPNHGLEFSENVAGRDEWCWCDALFMAPPVWMRLYAATGEAKYMEFAVERWWKTSDYLYDPEEHLYFRDNTFFKSREKNGRKVFWGRGNGWVMGGLVRTMQFLPKDHPSRARFEQQFKEMAAALLACQQPDGLWRSSLLDPERYPMGETSGSGFYCYAFAWGVNEGLLDRAVYEPAASRAWQGLLLCVAPGGKLTHAQQVGDRPAKFKADNSEVYAVGAFLLAGSEMHRLARLREQAE